jgi:hypothetical protein
VGIVYVMLGMATLFGVSAWFEKDAGRAGGMIALSIFATIGFIGSYCFFYFG